MLDREHGLPSVWQSLKRDRGALSGKQDTLPGPIITCITIAINGDLRMLRCKLFQSFGATMQSARSP